MKTKHARVPPVPPLPLAVLDKVEKVERYAKYGVSECGDSFSFNSEKATRLLRSCAVRVFQIQTDHYFTVKGCCPEWIEEIREKTVQSTVGLLGSHAEHWHRDPIKEEIGRTLKDYIDDLKTQAAAVPRNETKRIEVKPLSNRQRIEDFLWKATQSASRKMQKQDFWLVARYADRTEFQRFQRNDPRTSHSAIGAFERVLRMSPEEFARRASETEKHKGK